MGGSYASGALSAFVRVSRHKPFCYELFCHPVPCLYLFLSNKHFQVSSFSSRWAKVRIITYLALEFPFQWHIVLIICLFVCLLKVSVNINLLFHIIYRSVHLDCLRCKYSRWKSVSDWNCKCLYSVYFDIQLGVGIAQLIYSHIKETLLLFYHNVFSDFIHLHIVHRRCFITILHWYLHNVACAFQAIFCKTLTWMQQFLYPLSYHWSLVLCVQITTLQTFCRRSHVLPTEFEPHTYQLSVLLGTLIIWWKRAFVKHLMLSDFVGGN